MAVTFKIGHNMSVERVLIIYLRFNKRWQCHRNISRNIRASTCTHFGSNKTVRNGNEGKRQETGRKECAAKVSGTRKYMLSRICRINRNLKWIFFDLWSTMVDGIQYTLHWSFNFTIDSKIQISIEYMSFTFNRMFANLKLKALIFD